MEQLKALNALEPFLALAKSATSPRAAADLVTRATSANGTYVFTELLQTPNIQRLAKDPDNRKYLMLLEIFSYGTYADYCATSDLPTLGEQQLLKLRQLSVLTLAKEPRNLSYAALQTTLDLPNARELEDLVISTIYAGLLMAQLDPRNQRIHVSSISPLRDLAPNSIPSMLSDLENWSDRCTSTLADIEAQIAAIKAGAAARHSEKKMRAATQEKLISEETKDKSTSGVHTRGQTNLINRAVASMRGGPRPKRERNSNDEEDEGMDIDDDEYQAEQAEGSSAKKMNRRKT